MNQHPDTAPGSYYVTMVDGARVALLAGPFVNDHAGALAMVDQAHRIAVDLNPMYHFNAFGTARYPSDVLKPGVLNTQLGIGTMKPGTRYYITYRYSNQRRDRAAIMDYLGEEGTDYLFSARPVGGTQRVPKAALTSEPAERDSRHAIFLNRLL